VGLVTGHCHLNGHLFKLGLTDDPTCERCLEDESATHILCDCEAIAYLKFCHLGQVIMEPSDYYDAPWSPTFHSKCRINKGLIKWNSLVSDWKIIENGVPQGSVLGPLLFLIYINDLPNVINKTSLPILFANDTSILLAQPSITDLNNIMQNIFETLNKWFITNHLSLNFNKTHFIQFTAKKNTTAYLKIGIGNKLVTSTACTKFLGIWINENLSWDNHIEILIRKLSMAGYIIRSAKTYMSTSTLIIIYHAFFHSLMIYGIIFWGNSPHSKKIFTYKKW
jgi:hypothetical protein